MRATAEPVEGNKVRLSVEVEEAEVDRAVDDTIRSLTRQARIPGFRPGKVPRRVLEARMGGSGALRGEALREALPDFYAKAVVDADVDPITSPEIELKGGEEAGPVSFEALFEVRPTISVPGYNGLVVTVPSPTVTDEEVDAQIDRLRDTDAELQPVHRPARDGDQVTINLHGTRPGGEEVVGLDDYLYEVGSGSVVPELDDELRGSSPGAVLAFHAHVENTPTAFQVLVKKVQEKVLPELTDEWVEENTDSATVEELRREMDQRLKRVKVLQAQMALREGTMKALADLVEDAVVPDVLVDEEVAERVQDLDRRLHDRGASLQQLLAATGRSAEDLLAEVRAEAATAVKVDLALRAVADAEDIEVTEEDFSAELQATAERVGTTSAELRRRLDAAGRTGTLRAEQRKAQAADWLLEHVELVDDEGRPVERSALQVAPEDEAGQAEEGAPSGEGAAEVAPEVVQDSDAAVGDDVSGGESRHGTVASSMATEEGS